jgi:hypothetical protein
MPPLLLGLVLIGASLVALLPFALVIGAVYIGDHQRAGPLLALIALVTVLFPLLIVVTTPRRRHPRRRSLA